MHSSVLAVFRKNYETTFFSIVHIVLFSAGAAICARSLGLVGYGWGEMIALPSYYVLHYLAAGIVGSINYRVTAIWSGWAVPRFILAAARPVGDCDAFVAMLWPDSIRQLRDLFQCYRLEGSARRGCIPLMACAVSRARCSSEQGARVSSTWGDKAIESQQSDWDSVVAAMVVAIPSPALPALRRAVVHSMKLVPGQADLTWRIANKIAVTLRGRHGIAETYAGGRMLVDVADFIGTRIYHFGVWEPHLSELIGSRLKAGDVFCDVGANIGYYTVLAAPIVGDTGKVVAIEPSPATHEILAKNVKLNKASNVRMVRAAVSRSAEHAHVISGAADGLQSGGGDDGGQPWVYSRGRGAGLAVGQYTVA